MGFKFATNRVRYDPFRPSLDESGFLGKSRVRLHKINIATCSFPLLPFLMPMTSSITVLLEVYPYQTVAVLFFGYMLFRHWQLRKGRSNPRRLPLPPGPKGYPLIGSLFDLPVDKAWLVYEEWSKTYGESFEIKG